MPILTGVGVVSTTECRCPTPRPSTGAIREDVAYSAPVALLAASVLAGPPDPDREPLDPAWPPVLIAAVLGFLVVVVIVAVMFFRRARAAARGEP